MNLLFFMDFISSFKGILISLYNIIHNNFFQDTSNPEMVNAYLGDTNRMIIFILGITVSSNIYLFNTRTKISASSIWTTKHIRMLILTLLINLLMVFLSFFVLHNQLILSTTLSANNLRIILIIHFILKVSSIFFLLLTLWNFITSFWLEYNLKKSIKGINKLIFPKKYFELYKYKKDIIRYSNYIFNRNLGNTRIKNQKVNVALKKINQYKFTLLTKSLIVNLFRKIYAIFYLIKLIFIREHILIDRTSFLSNKEINLLRIKIEILCQNLEYIISSNSDISMDKYCKEWNSIFNRIVIMLFHINTKELNNNASRIPELYRTLIHNHSKLISLTAASYENRNYHKDFIKSMLHALAHKEESIDEFMTNGEFEKRTELLEEIFFDELFSLLINSMKNKKYEILDLLQTDELNINSFISSKNYNQKYYGNRDRKTRYEQLFISTLIKMIELNITENLTSLIAIIFSLRDESTTPEKSIKGSRLLSKKKKKNTHNEIEETIIDYTVNLSYENLKALIYATIKANELENYKTAGYLIKVISSNIKHHSLVSVLTDLYLATSKNNRNIYFDTGIYKVDFNDYSFQYCLYKTIVLINAQYFYKKDYESMQDFKIIHEAIDCSYFIKKLMFKHKEYGMISLDEIQLNQFEYYINNEIE